MTDRGLGCRFDYSTPDGRALVESTIAEILEIRDELEDPAAARRVRRDERLYERTLGLAVAPVLLWRAVSRRLSNRDVMPSADTTPDLIGVLRQEIEHDSMSPKLALYERSLGLAVVPVLLREPLKRMRRR